MANFNFISSHSLLEEARLCILGVPYDGTASYRPGSRFAPMAIREASHGLETYSPYLDASLSDIQVADLGDLILPFASYSAVFRKVYKRWNQLLKRDKKIIALGGEHLISYPILRAYLNFYPELILVHYDAHADFRNAYLGDRYSHATVIRRIYPFFKKKHIYQFGIRSAVKKEWNLAKKKNNFFPFCLEQQEEAFSCIPMDHPIYISLDLDILDPSILPGTGTPEPGGVSFNELIKALAFFKNRNVIGADIVELAPDYDLTKVSNITAAKILREMLLMIH